MPTSNYCSNRRGIDDAEITPSVKRNLSLTKIHCIKINHDLAQISYSAPLLMKHLWRKKNYFNFFFFFKNSRNYSPSSATKGSMFRIFNVGLRNPFLAFVRRAISVIKKRPLTCNFTAFSPFWHNLFSSPDVLNKEYHSLSVSKWDLFWWGSFSECCSEEVSCFFWRSVY